MMNNITKKEFVEKYKHCDLLDNNYVETLSLSKISSILQIYNNLLAENNIEDLKALRLIDFKKDLRNLFDPDWERKIKFKKILGL